MTDNMIMGGDLEGLSPDEMKEIQTLIEQSEEQLQYFEYDGKDYRLKVAMVNKSDNPIPTYAKEGDSGFDLRAYLPEGPITLKPLQRALVPTGNFFAVPYGFEMQVRPRSGLAIKHGITVLNTPGTVDSGYRGEVCAILINLSDKEFVIESGERICQAVIAPVIHNVKLVQKTSLDETQRGGTGFGSSGTK